jgi:aspartyl-tRNA(Asn)/glutamyl-tRNA(Gln) amidotransferase subunit B
VSQWIETGSLGRKSTMGWDEATGTTFLQREKEEAHDYRYFPEPDLPPLVVDADRIERLRADLPELPEARRARFVASYGIPDYDAGVLTQSGLAGYFEQVAGAAGNPKAASNWVMGELLRTLNERGTAVADVPLQPAALAGLIALVDKGTISNAIAKDVFPKMYASGRSAADIVAAEGLAQNSDESAVLEIVRAVMAANAETVAQYRAGSQKTFGFLVGQVMKGSGGKANPKLANALLKRELDSPS